MAPRRWQPEPGAELAISYGDKSNEELLFHYGAPVAPEPTTILSITKCVAEGAELAISCGDKSNEEGADPLAIAIWKQRVNMGRLDAWRATTYHCGLR